MAIKPTGGSTGPGSAGGIGVIRPMYGVFIRDQVAQYRDMLGATLGDLKAGIKTGKPHKHAVARDGILEGSELTKAKKAAIAVDKAMKELKPVFGNSWPNPMNADSGRASLGRPGGGFVAMYGVILADDLTKYRTGISNDIAAIKNAIDSGELKGTAKTEATKAMKDLNRALKALGSVTW